VHAPDYDEEKEKEEEAEGGMVFVVAAELGPGESACGSEGGVERRDDGLFGRGETREEQRDGVGVSVEGGAVVAAEFEFLAAHHEGVDEGEIGEKEKPGGPGVHGDGGAEGEDAASEVERIASVGVGAGGGEEFLFVEVAGGIGADDEAEEADASADEDGTRYRAREIENDEGQGIADADAPAGKEVEGGHAEAPRRWRTASKTWSTEILSNEGEVWDSRSWVVMASGSRRTMGCGG